MSKKIYIYTSNHKSILGIKTHITILKNILRPHKVLTTNKIRKNCINIFIENFKKKDVDKINYYKEKHNITVILVLTEFVNSNAKIFNCFELKKNFNKLIPYQYFSLLNLVILTSILYIIFITSIKGSEINIENFYLLIFIYTFYFLRKSYFYMRLKLRNFILKNTSFNLRKYRKIRNKFFGPPKRKKIIIKQMKWYSKLVMYRYFRERFINNEKVVKSADIILTTHPQIYRSYKAYKKPIFYMIPKIKKFLPNINSTEKLLFKFSGELSKYRLQLFKKIIDRFNTTDNKIISKNIHNFEQFLLKYKEGSFIDISKKRKFKYSFHPRKNTIWEYSSPIRYIEAISNGEVPIVFDNFKDFFTKNLTIKLKQNSSKNIDQLSLKYISFVSLLKRRIKKYNQFTEKNLNEMKSIISSIK